jgi:hypothetical protein
VRATAVHPGGIRTELGRHLTKEIEQSIIDEINKQLPGGAAAFTYKTVPQGAATSVWAGIVAKAEDVGGKYCEDCHIAELNDAGPSVAARGGVRAYAIDPGRAKALWAKSEEWVGERFRVE